MQEIIENINNDIAAILPKLDLKAYALAESVSMRSDEEVTFPALVLPNGECISVWAKPTNTM